MRKTVEFPADRNGYDCVHCFWENINWGDNGHCRHCRREYAEKFLHGTPPDTVVCVQYDGTEVCYGHKNNVAR